MIDRCPTCGQSLPRIDGVPRICTAEALVAAMQIPPPPSDNKRYSRGSTRDVYEGYREGKIPTGRFYVTYQGGQVTRSAVEDAVRRGLIRLKYDCDGYWCLA